MVIKLVYLFGGKSMGRGEEGGANKVFYGNAKVALFLFIFDR